MDHRKPAKVVGYIKVPMGRMSRLFALAAGVVFIAPSPEADLVAVVLLIPVMIEQHVRSKTCR